MNILTAAVVLCAALGAVMCNPKVWGYGGYGGYGLGYGGGYGGGYGAGYGGGYGVGSSVALLRGGPGLYKAVPGPVFLVKTIHQVNKLSGGGALVAHSGLGGGGYGIGYGGLGYGGLGGGLGYGGLGYGGLGYGGLEYGGKKY
ncbi:uncharacterized protein LOC144119369 [Amblyomma americanum]